MITVVVIAVALLTSSVALVAAQEPVTGEEASLFDPLALGLEAEAVPLGLDAMLYQLAAGTTFEDVAAAYEAAMESAGWASDPEVAPPSKDGINALSWSNGDVGCAIMYLPATSISDPQLLVLLASPPSDEEFAAEGEAPLDAEVPADEVGAGDVPECACCEPLAAGKGGLWFENFMGDMAHYDINGPETITVDLPAKQGEASGCAFVQLTPGKYSVQGKTDRGAQANFEIEVEAGVIMQIPALVEGT